MFCTLLEAPLHTLGAVRCNIAHIAVPYSCVLLLQVELFTTILCCVAINLYLVYLATRKLCALAPQALGILCAALLWVLEVRTH
jgi:hypothetical protein